jgi:hypothetical protein
MKKANEDRLIKGSEFDTVNEEIKSRFKKLEKEFKVLGEEIEDLKKRTPRP